MGKCVRCGKKGLFLKINRDGYCADCAVLLAEEAIEKNRRAQRKAAYSELKNQESQNNKEGKNITPHLKVSDKGTFTISFSDIPETKDLLLTSKEEIAINNLKKILVDHNFSVENLTVERTQTYLTVRDGKNLPFCRLKMNGNVFYISLCIDSEDAKKLQDNPYYSNLNKENKKFTRFDIASEVDIFNYRDGIISSFQFMNPELRKKRLISLDTIDLSPNMKAFFGKMEAYSDSAQKYKLSNDEIAFFSAYIDKLSEYGLDWTMLKPNRMSDGAIKVWGGCVKLQGKKTYMFYTLPGEELSHYAENLTLPQYIELQRHWVEYCFSKKEIFKL